MAQVNIWPMTTIREMNVLFKNSFGKFKSNENRFRKLSNVAGLGINVWVNWSAGSLKEVATIHRNGPSMVTAPAIRST